LQGFAHDDTINQYAFFNPQDHSSDSDSSRPSTSTASLNTLGYSPIPLATCLSFITNITTKAAAASKQPPTRTKPFIISITGSPTDIADSYRLISTAQANIPATNPLCIEINLSCPNIPDKPPPAYSKIALFEYLKVLENVQREVGKTGAPKIAVGLKTPPYTYHDQFRTLMDALLEAPECEISFLTATNTLGSSLLLRADSDSGFSSRLSSASGLGIGGLAGAPLHPLALGNVKTLRGMLDSHEELKGVQIIGVGGVADSEGFARMRAVGASVVGVGTVLGKEGMGVFGKILGRTEGARL
jgi:dihydroorotate dehydrogenase (fumarate)